MVDLMAVHSAATKADQMDNQMVGSSVHLMVVYSVQVKVE